MKSLRVTPYIVMSIAILALPALSYGETIVRNNSSAAAATFSQTDPSGCVQTMLDVGALVSVIHYQPPGAPNTSVLAHVNVAQFDQCNSTYSNMFGITENADFQISQSMSNARLRAEIPACDLYGVCVNLAIDVEWTGTGEPSRSRVIQHMSGPFASLVSRYSGLNRDAQAVGSVLNGSVNLTPNPSIFGFMGTEQNFLLDRN